MKTSLLTLALAGILAAPGSAFAAEKKEAAPPDFTKGDAKPADAKHDWTLGPTGARGWYHTANGHSRLTRQTLVAAVAKGSPAEGR